MSDDGEIAQAIRNRELVVFAGSGFSRDAGLPSWPELVGGLTDRLVSLGALSGEVASSITNLVSIGALPAALEVLQSSVGRGPVIGELRNLLEPKRESRVVKAAASWHLKGIVTTNFDRVTELALGNNCFRIFNDLASLKLLTTAVGSSGQYLWKIHGDIDNGLDPADQRVAQGGAGFVVLTKSDFTALMQGDRGRQLTFGLHTVLLSNPVLFLGYSLADPDIAWMLDLLKESFQFPKPAWFLCPPGAEPTNLPPNVAPITAISDWGQLADWMEAVASGAPRQRPSHAAPATPAALTAQERECYLTISRYLADLESPDLSERVVASALIDDMAAAQQFDLAWLAGRVQEIVGVGPGLARSLAEATIRYLAEIGAIQADGAHCQVDATAIGRLRGKAQAEWREQRSRFFASVAARLPSATAAVAARLEDAIEAVLIDICSELGEAMAEWVSRGVGSDIGWGDVQQRLEGILDDGELVRQGDQLIRLVLTDPSDNEVPYLYRLLAATFLANSVRLNPVAASQLQASLAQYELYLDANVLLPLVVAEHPAHRATTAVLGESVRAGVKLMVLQPIYGEVTSHREIAKREFHDFGGDVGQLRDLSGTLGARTNVFTSGFLSLAGGSATAAEIEWPDYIAKYSDSGIRARLEEAGIEVVQPAIAATQGPLYHEALANIEGEWQARLGYRRDRILDINEAVQMAHTYLERERDPSRRQHIWFLSNETVLHRVFERNPSRWVLPATFPYSAWTAFLDSRMPWASSDPRAIVRAILKSQPQAFELPSPVRIVRERAFGSRVTSREEEDALELATSDFALMKRVESAQRAVFRRGNTASATKDLGEFRRGAVAEITGELGSQISRLQAALSQKNQRLKAAEDRIKALERGQTPARQRKKKRPQGA